MFSLKLDSFFVVIPHWVALSHTDTHMHRESTSKINSETRAFSI